jgi:hypothetical protein
MPSGVSRSRASLLLLHLAGVAMSGCRPIAVRGPRRSRSARLVFLATACLAVFPEAHASAPVYLTQEGTGSQAKADVLQAFDSGASLVSGRWAPEGILRLPALRGKP